MKTTISDVRIAVARFGFTFATPILAKIAVRAANKADRSAQVSQFIYGGKLWQTAFHSSIMQILMGINSERVLSKVPHVTLVFWIIKIIATTLGETGGDAVSMSLNLGYAFASVIFLAIFLLAVLAQIQARKFHPLLYWLVIVATTTAGTTIADFCDRSLGIGYFGGTSILAVLLVLSLGIWFWSAGSISVESITSPKVEMFYWTAIMFSQTLGTALGDWMADTNGLGYQGSALVFAGGLALIAGAYFWTNISQALLFWAAFILTRPLGATVGDFLDKPAAHGGLEIDRFTASGVLIFLMIMGIFLACRLQQRAPVSSK